jgi:hypothetical protein
MSKWSKEDLKIWLDAEELRKELELQTNIYEVYEGTTKKENTRNLIKQELAEVNKIIHSLFDKYNEERVS